jgi:membrane protein DedA with SNARE-associated domain
MRWRKFLPANASGGIVWAGIYTWVAYLAGHTLSRLSGTIDLIVGLVAVVAIVIVFVVVRRQVDKLGDLAEAAFPGPLE